MSYKVESLPLNVVVPGDNDRTVFQQDDVEQLARSIKQDGLAQPITVRLHPTREGFYEIVAGERRSRAFRWLNEQYPAEFAEIPAMIRELTDIEASGIMLAENVHRSDLNCMDESRAYKKRIDMFGWTVAEMASKAKMATRRVQARLDLLNLVPEIQELLEKGIFQPTWAALMASLDNDRQRIALRYWTTTEKPALREFQAICGRLMADQSQSLMFDPDEFIFETAQAATEAVREQQRRRFPVSDAVPEFRKTGTIGESMENYIGTLLQQGNLEVAGIAGTIYQGMLRYGMACCPSRKTVLDDVPQRKEADLLNWGTHDETRNHIKRQAS